LRVVARFLHRSRETQKERAQNKAEELRQTQSLLLESQQQVRQLEKQLSEKSQQLKTVQQELTELHERPIRFPHDPNLPHHSHGAKMISLCCNLARAVGFRGANRVLNIFREELKWEIDTPTHETIRVWLMRLGVFRLLLQEVEKKDGEYVWYVDHSCKVGLEQVMVVLGIRAQDLPPPGTPLKHEDLTTLLVAAGEIWKREDVALQYDALKEQIGAPLAIISDQAIELQEPVLALKNGGKPVLLLTDPKHKLANIIKSVVGKDERFLKFQTKLGQTRAAIQQTELSPFTPPKQKTKARFMNLRSTINWGEMVQWQLANPHSSARSGITADRMKVKLGWLRSFRKDIQKWNRCLDVVSVTLTFVNEQGLFAGAAERLDQKLRQLELCPTSRLVKKRTLEFIRKSEQDLKSLEIPELRVCPSTEILESAFGRYKQLEGQHSHGGFTSLLASFATLLKPTTDDEIKEAFTQVTTKKMKSWVKEKLGNTLQSKKNQAYAEYKQTMQT
jgi:hypothetical protein